MWFLTQLEIIKCEINFEFFHKLVVILISNVLLNNLKNFPPCIVSRWMRFCSPPPLTQGHCNQQCKNNLAVTTFEYIKTIGTPLTSAYIWTQCTSALFKKYVLCWGFDDNLTPTDLIRKQKQNLNKNPSILGWINSNFSHSVKKWM